MSTPMPTGDDIPKGPTLETALDRLQRASNFAGNGVYLVENRDEVAAMLGRDVADPAETLETYIWSAEQMLAEARKALEGMKAVAR